MSTPGARMGLFGRIRSSLRRQCVRYGQDPRKKPGRTFGVRWGRRGYSRLKLPLAIAVAVSVGIGLLREFPLRKNSLFTSTAAVLVLVLHFLILWPFVGKLLRKSSRATQQKVVAIRVPAPYGNTGTYR